MVSRLLTAIAALASTLAPLAASAAGEAMLRAEIEMTRIDSPSISPDGRWALWREFRASIAGNTYVADWMIAPVAGGVPARRLADAGEIEWLNGYPLPTKAVWVDGSARVLFRKVAGGEIQVWAAAPESGGLRQVTHAPGNVRDIATMDDGRTVLVAIGPDRSRIAAAEQAEYEAGTLIDKTVDPQRPLYRGDHIDGRWASGRLRGFWFEQGGILPSEDPQLRLLDTATGELRAPTETQRAAYAPPARAFERLGPWYVYDRQASGDARGTAVLLARGNQTRIAVVDPAAAERTRCAAPACTQTAVRSVRWMGTDDAILFETRDSIGGSSVLWRWDTRSGVVTRIAGGDGYLNGSDDGYGCAASASFALCIASSANSPPRVVSIARASGQIESLSDPNAALRGKGAQFERLEWRDRKGRQFSGYLARPGTAAGPVPLFITYYACGGYLRGGLGDEYPLRAMAASGIAALCINRYPAEPGIGGNIDAYRTAASGIEAIVTKLSRDEIVDPARIGAGGVSFGGEVATWLAIHTRLLRAVSVANVMVTPTYYWLNAVKGRDVPAVLRSGWGLGPPDVSAKAWRTVSPAFNADRITAAFLKQIPEQEYRPNVELLARLQAAGKQAELWAFPQEMHIKWQPVHQFAANRRNLAWFVRWLGPLKRGDLSDVTAGAAQASGHDGG